jgi:hypothetical protein
MIFKLRHRPKLAFGSAADNLFEVSMCCGENDLTLSGVA